MESSDHLRNSRAQRTPTPYRKLHTVLSLLFSSPTSRRPSIHNSTALFKMHFLKGLILSLLPAAALAAKQPAVDKFNQFHTKALASTPLKLDDSVYPKLTAAPRDYSVIVLLTAMEPRFGCALCREFQPEWDLLSSSWTKGDKKGDSRLVFGTLDFVDGKNTFQSVSTLAET